MNNKSINEIQNDINISMIKLGKFIIIRSITFVLFLTNLFISIYNFILIFWDISKKEYNSIILCIIFMILSLIFIALHVTIVNICLNIKRNIYNNKKLLNKIK